MTNKNPPTHTHTTINKCEIILICWLNKNNQTVG